MDTAEKNRYEDKEYCYSKIAETRFVFGNTKTTRIEWQTYERILALILLYGPKDLFAIASSTMDEMAIRETHFIFKVWPFQKKQEKVIKWPMCNHFYAKVGGEDVYDKSGNYKWNTEKEAKRALEWFKGERL